MDLLKVHASLVGTKPTEVQTELYTGKEDHRPGFYRGWRSNELDSNRLQAILVGAIVQAHHSSGSTILITPAQQLWVREHLDSLIKELPTFRNVQRAVERIGVRSPDFIKPPRGPWMAFGFGGGCYVPSWMEPRLLTGGVGS